MYIMERINKLGGELDILRVNINSLTVDLFGGFSDRPGSPAKAEEQPCAHDLAIRSLEKHIELINELAERVDGIRGKLGMKDDPPSTGLIPSWAAQPGKVVY